MESQEISPPQLWGTRLFKLTIQIWSNLYEKINYKWLKRSKIKELKETIEKGLDQKIKATTHLIGILFIESSLKVSSRDSFKIKPKEVDTIDRVSLSFYFENPLKRKEKKREIKRAALAYFTLRDKRTFVENLQY